MSNDHLGDRSMLSSWNGEVDARPNEHSRPGDTVILQLWPDTLPATDDDSLDMQLAPAVARELARRLVQAADVAEARQFAFEREILARDPQLPARPRRWLRLLKRPRTQEIS